MFILDNSVIQIILSPGLTKVRKLPNGKYQITYQKGSQAFHKNIEAADLQEWFDHAFKSPFKQAQIYTQEADYHLLLNHKGEIKTIKKPATLSNKPIVHNRLKNYLFDEDFFKKLGISLDKRRQVEKFAELVSDTLSDLPNPLHVVDFGCGKAYLTFALYAFLEQKGLTFSMTGIDQKEKVMEDSNLRAQELGFKNIHFINADILGYEGPVDLSLSLHACDIATDIALAKAIRSKAKVIMAAPCCQHEFFKQIESDTFEPLLKHGLLKERLSSLITDALRGLVLESHGYQVQMIEFIDSSHTPKNLLIRALYQPNTKKQTESSKKLTRLCQEFNLKPKILELLS